MTEVSPQGPEQFDVSEFVASAVNEVKELTERQRALSDTLMSLTDEQRGAFMTELGRQSAASEPTTAEGEKYPDPLDDIEAHDLTRAQALQSFALGGSNLNNAYFKAYHEGMGWNG